MSPAMAAPAFDSAMRHPEAFAPFSPAPPDSTSGTPMVKTFSPCVACFSVCFEASSVDANEGRPSSTAFLTSSGRVGLTVVSGIWTSQVSIHLKYIHDPLKVLDDSGAGLGRRRVVIVVDEVVVAEFDEI